MDHVVNEPTSPDLFVFITHLIPPNSGGAFMVGTAWRGSVCAEDNANVNGGTANGKGYRTSINSWVSTDFACAEVRHQYIFEATILKTTSKHM